MRSFIHTGSAPSAKLNPGYRSHIGSRLTSNLVMTSRGIAKSLSFPFSALSPTGESESSETTGPINRSAAYEGAETRIRAARSIDGVSSAARRVSGTNRRTMGSLRFMAHLSNSNRMTTRTLSCGEMPRCSGITAPVVTKVSENLRPRIGFHLDILGPRARRILQPTHSAPARSGYSAARQRVAKRVDVVGDCPATQISEQIDLLGGQLHQIQ